MNIVETALLKEGQKFSGDVFLEDDTLFLPANVAIRKKDLEFVKSMGVTELYTSGKIIDVVVNRKTSSNTQNNASVVSEAKDAAQTAFSKVENSQTNRKIESFVKQLDGIFNAIKNHRVVNVRSLWQITASLLQIIKTNRTDAINSFLGGTIEEYAMAKNSVNVAILVAVIGEDLEFAVQKIPELVAGALLHDVGMLRLPPEIVHKKSALSVEDAQLIASHPVLSYKIIKNELLYPHSVCQIALQHHERWDGTGYPSRLKGNNIDKGALIVSITDAFEAMVCEKPYRNSMIGYEAMKTLVSENAAHFSPDMLKAFVKVMGIYPIGSGVQLNDGSIARVVEIHSDIPLRPVIQILLDGNGTEVTKDIIIDLLTNKDRFITRAMDIRGMAKRF
ncbi:metal-dependent phosphohydrolase [Spirochaetia bacterium]|nr:metal-dependent phosphohydrolase [Spirochaetia bacterium]